MVAKQGNMFEIIWENGEDIVYIVQPNRVVYCYLKKLNKNKKSKWQKKFGIKKNT